MLISVHFPKTAGSSFGHALKCKFGRKLKFDFADWPMHLPLDVCNEKALRDCRLNSGKKFRNVECIHGHFFPVKYLGLAEVRGADFIAWMRNPVDRLISHYYYWKRTYRPWSAPFLLERGLSAYYRMTKSCGPWGAPFVHRTMMEEEWSLERFCLGPEVRNTYSAYLYQFPLSRFSFIGITEFYEEDFEFFCKNYFGEQLPPQKINVGNKDGRYSIDESLREEIETFHSEDMDLYEQALELRRKRYL